jgi:hypothetical protein
VTINQGTGNMAFDAGNGTYGSFVMGLDEITNVTSTADVQVFESPVSSIIQNADVLTLSNDSLSNYFWYHNGAMLTGQNGPSLTMSGSGYYYAVMSNVYGCSFQTDSILYCAPAEISFNNSLQQLSIENVYQSYQWFYNGIALTGATTYYLVNPADGVYAVEVTNEFGCTMMSNTWVVNAIEEESEVVSLFPNPIKDWVRMSGLSNWLGGEIQMVNAIGQVEMSDKIQSTIWQRDLSHLTPGIYQLVIKKNERQQVLKLVKNEAGN